MCLRSIDTQRTKIEVLKAQVNYVKTLGRQYKLQVSIHTATNKTLSKPNSPSCSLIEDFGTVPNNHKGLFDPTWLDSKLEEIVKIL
jgi:hypothetical protein